MTDSDAELSAGRLGRVVGGRWRLESVLGVGGMAAVYGGRDASGSVAAIKILHPEMSVRREVRERFLREGYVANRIGHPGVVQALEHGETGDEVFLAMELLAGETLRARVKRHGRLPVGEVLDYADQILDVLAVAHEKGIVHRDLKPDNLFVSPDGRIKILDFGLARVLDGVPAEHRTRTGVALGTLAYMAPEQALGRRAEIDGRVDIFALGATMFRVLSGRRVHEAESEAELLMAMASRPAPPLAIAVPGISPSVASVVDLALAFSRDARYPDARTMQGDVRALRQGQHAAYASARLSSREEATRAEIAPTTSQRTQPLSATMASHLPGTSGTAPMPANSFGVIATAPGYGEPVPAPPQGPTSMRTAPLGAHPGAGIPAGTAMPGPASFATTMPSTQAPFVVPAFATSQPALTPERKTSRNTVVVFLALAFVGVALAGGAGAWYALSGPNSETAATPAPSAPALPEAVAPPATIASPPSEPAPGQPAPEAPGAAPKKGSSKKPDAVAEPSATATASVAPPATPSATSDAPAPPAPTSSAAAAPTPPAPAAPSAAPPAPTAPPAPAPASDTSPPPPAKRGRGKRK